MHPLPLPAASGCQAPCALSPDQVPAHDALLDGILDAIDVGLLVCDEHGTPEVVNAAAQRELARRRLLCLHAGNVRACGDEGDLSSALAAACRRGLRQAVALRHGDERLYAVVSPLRAKDGRCLGLVMLGRCNSCSELSLELLGISHGLTLSERRVLVELAAQRRPARIAQDRAVALSTVRTQIGAVHAKLGVRSRQELLCLVGGVPPLALTLRQGPLADASPAASVWKAAA